MSFSISPWIYFGVLGDFILVFYKLLICQSEREILKRLGQHCTLSSMKCSLSASPAGIFLQGCSSAGLHFSVCCGFTVVPLPILWWISPLPGLRITSRIMQSLFFILEDLLWILLVRTYVCASVQHGLKTQFSFMKETRSCKTKEY